MKIFNRTIVLSVSSDNNNKVNNMADGKLIIDIDLAEDVKQLVKVNEDIQISAELKNKINNFSNDDFLKVTKCIGSLKILNVELVDEALLAEEL